MNRINIITILLVLLIGLSACNDNATTSNSIESAANSILEIEEKPQTQRPAGLFDIAPTDYTMPTRVIDKYGKQHPYSVVGRFSDGYAAVYLHIWCIENEQTAVITKCGLIDKDGNVIVPFIYGDIGEYDYNERIIFREGLARVMDQSGRYGFIDQTGAEVVPCVYDGAGHFSEGLAAVEKDGMDGFIDRTGTEIIPFQYEYAGRFQEGLAKVNKGDLYGFIDKTGKDVIPCMYNSADDFSEGLARVWKMGVGEGFIDQTGAEVIPLTYLIAGSFRDGLAIVMKGEHGNTQNCFIDKAGNEVISTLYIMIYKFNDGLAAAKRRTTDWNDGWGFLDKNGKVAIPMIYEDIGRIGDDNYGFYEGFSAVKDGGLWGVIDRYGNVVVPLQYESVQYITNDVVVESDDGEYGIMNADGTVRWPDALNEIIAKEITTTEKHFD